MSKINLRPENRLLEAIKRLAKKHDDISLNGFICKELHEIAKANDPKYASQNVVLDFNRAKRRKTKSKKVS
jgi:hypothetical protein